MPTLTLTKCWFNIVPDGTAISAYVGPERTRAHSLEGEVQTFAGGRRRAISREGEITTIPLLLRAVSTADAEVLRTWKGMTVEFRDPYGLQFYGTFFDVAIKSYRDAFHDVAIVFAATTFVEGA